MPSSAQATAMATWPGPNLTSAALDDIVSDLTQVEESLKKFQRTGGVDASLLNPEGEACAAAQMLALMNEDYRWDEDAERMRQLQASARELECEHELRQRLQQEQERQRHVQLEGLQHLLELQRHQRQQHAQQGFGLEGVMSARNETDAWRGMFAPEEHHTHRPGDSFH
jgi:hypothetical protein